MTEPIKQITVGMSFGTVSSLAGSYNSKLEVRKSAQQVSYYDKKAGCFLESDNGATWFDAGKGVKVAQYKIDNPKGKKKHNDNNLVKRKFECYDNGGIMLEYSNTGRNKNGRVSDDIRLDRIILGNQYAIDKNDNGVVDEGEIFEI